MLQLPQSNPDLNVHPSKRKSRRESRGPRNSKEFREWEFRIINPLNNMGEENNLPAHIKSQIEQLEYISNNAIKRIDLPQPRRTSTMIRNLQMMQELAMKQQEKFTGMMNEQGMNTCTRRTSDQLDMLGINMMQQDEVSLQLHGFYDYKERIYDDFNLFNKEDNFTNYEDPTIFYSQHQIELGFQMDEELNNYIQ